MARRRPLSWYLVIAFLVVPIVEIYVIIQVGHAIGAWPTVLLLILDSLIGSWLIKREGRRAWQALSTALQSGRMPADELSDGALILIGGTLMLSPGFVLDVVGLLLILPVTRPVFRRLLARAVSRRLTVIGPMGPMTGPGQTSRPGPGSQGPVIRGEVVED